MSNELNKLIHSYRNLAIREWEENLQHTSNGLSKPFSAELSTLDALAQEIGIDGIVPQEEARSDESSGIFLGEHEGTCPICRKMTWNHAIATYRHDSVFVKESCRGHDQPVYTQYFSTSLTAALGMPLQEYIEKKIEAVFQYYHEPTTIAPCSIGAQQLAKLARRIEAEPTLAHVAFDMHDGLLTTPTLLSKEQRERIRAIYKEVQQEEQR